MHTILLAAILTLARPAGLDTPEHRPWFERIAADVELAATLHDGAPFRGAARRESLGLALVALAWHESAFRPAVASCRITGDRTRWQKSHEGRSITLWQLMRGPSWDGHERQELCESQPLAAYLAVKVLIRYEQPARWNWGALFRGYASGSAGVDSSSARKCCATRERLATQAGLDGAHCHGRGMIGFAPPQP